MKTVTGISLENERCKKWTEKMDECSIFRRMRSVRGKASASFATKKYTISEYIEKMHVFRVRCHVNKKIDVSIEQRYTIKFCMRLIKLRGETSGPLKEALQILLVSCVEI